MPGGFRGYPSQTWTPDSKPSRPGFRSVAGWWFGVEGAAPAAPPTAGFASFAGMWFGASGSTGGVAPTPTGGRILITVTDTTDVTGIRG